MSDEFAYLTLQFYTPHKRIGLIVVNRHQFVDKIEHIVHDIHSLRKYAHRFFHCKHHVDKFFHGESHAVKHRKYACIEMIFAVFHLAFYCLSAEIFYGFFHLASLAVKQFAFHLAFVVLDYPCIGIGFYLFKLSLFFLSLCHFFSPVISWLSCLSQQPSRRRRTLCLASRRAFRAQACCIVCAMRQACRPVLSFLFLCPARWYFCRQVSS